MATILNRKKYPLGLAEARKRFENGVQVHCCNKGICLISSLGSDKPAQYWVDLSGVLNDTLEPEPTFYDHGWIRQRAIITMKVNDIFGTPTLTLI